MQQHYENCQMIITINNNFYYKIAYSYNINTTFQDLLEYFSSLFPSLDVCPCYDFSVESNHNKQRVTKDSLIRNYSQYFNKLCIDKNNNIVCSHLNNNYLKSSKETIISFFQNEKKQNEIIVRNNFDKVNKEKMLLQEKNNNKKVELAKIIKEKKDLENKNNELMKKISDFENKIELDLNGKDNTIANLKKK